MQNYHQQKACTVTYITQKKFLFLNKQQIMVPLFARLYNPLCDKHHQTTKTDVVTSLKILQWQRNI